MIIEFYNQLLLQCNKTITKCIMQLYRYKVMNHPWVETAATELIVINCSRCCYYYTELIVRNVTVYSRTDGNVRLEREV